MSQIHREITKDGVQGITAVMCGRYIEDRISGIEHRLCKQDSSHAQKGAPSEMVE